MEKKKLSWSTPYENIKLKGRKKHPKMYEVGHSHGMSLLDQF